MTRILTLILTTFIAITSMAAGKYVLVIDAGHGGHDAGAIGSFSKEKDINLKTALAFGQLVEQNCSDVMVIYTRKTDVFIPLNQRAEIANKNHADVFISIHTNALPSGRIARGIETYTMGMRRSNEKLSAAQRENSVITYEKGYQETYAGYDPNSPESAIMFEFINDKNMAESVELAKLVQKDLCSSASRADKGVKQDVFLVLRETSMPACLIELGFISTPDEETLLNNKDHINKMAHGIYSAFVKYKNKKTGKGEVANNTAVPFAGEVIASAAAVSANGKEATSTASGKETASTGSKAKKVSEAKAEAAPVVSNAATQPKKRRTYHVRRPEPETTGGVSSPATPNISHTARGNTLPPVIGQDNNQTSVTRQESNQTTVNQAPVIRQENRPVEVGRTYTVVYNHPDNVNPVSDPAPAPVQQPQKPVTSNAKVVSAKKPTIVPVTVDTTRVEKKPAVDTVRVEQKPAVDTIKVEQKTMADTVKAVKQIIADTIVAKQESPIKQDTIVAKQEPPIKQDTIVANQDTVVFKVQLMSGRTILKDGDPRFHGLTGTSYYMENDVYKYTVGNCATAAEAAELKKSIADKFPDAFVVAFLNDKRISIGEAMQMVKKR